MDLKTYLEANELSISAFANRIGVEHETVRRYLRGERLPTRRVMQVIVRETNGHVTPNDFYTPRAA